MPYIELATSRYPVSECEIRDAHPNLTFASPFSPDGYALVFPTPQPAHSAISEYVREVSPVLTNKGVWEQHWEVLALPAEQIAEKQAAAVQALVRSITDATQRRLDDFARTRNYDSILSACTYATSSVPKFAAEGQCAVNARDATWAALYGIMAEVEAGTRPMPTSFEDVEHDLPVLAWPS